MNKIVIILPFVLLSFSGCKHPQTKNMKTSNLEKKVEEYVPFALKTDLSKLSENQKKMLPLLIEVAQIMDDIYWKEAYGDKDKLFASLTTDAQREFANINYGPWDRLDNNKPFIEGVGEKPKGANFYPVDMTVEEFNAYDSKDKDNLYTLIRRDSAGKLITIPYHVAFKEQIEKAATLLKKAAGLAENEGFKKYLQLRADALLTDQYFNSDMAWMDMKDNLIDFVVGPIETYEDELFGYKASHEAYILVKDMEWSQRLARYASLLPQLQKGLPVNEKYKTEKPGSNSDLGAYDAIYYAGDCNAGSKTIAINLPNDPKVQLKKGSRRLQLKNAMQAKFEKILVPISKELIANDQQSHITFDAFFANTMFHEVAHGLGIKNTINGKGPVREALKDRASGLEEGKADILGLYLVTKLNEMKEINVDLMDNYTTFLAGLFRSIRFGASSAHGSANLVRFNYFKEKGAFTLNDQGKYSVNFEKMQEAVNSLSALILTIQGNGDYEGAGKLLEEYGKIGDNLQKALDRLKQENIPVDIVFEQGTKVLGIQ
jgi:hypothetical protein